ncbi:Essential protein Yae1, N terminal [Sporothrix curviconia]|uniref:Protein YAE1 n=1 Tax=Sporothrix curviconia TaxID=1260050 RepID=A0ABP0CLG6_9PEZI
MHQRPPADPSNKDDLLAPAGISFATMDPSPEDVAVVGARDAAGPAVDASTVYHGEAIDEAGGSAVDLFDDVFGTSPTSGDIHHHGHHEHQEHHDHGDHDESHLPAPDAATVSPLTIPTSAGTASASGHRREHHEHHDHHPSDMNRLQQDHSTAGYREGLSAGKNNTLQTGFDEGYPLGAALGTMVGRLLGLLEGLVVALPGGDAGGTGEEEQAESLSALLVRARQDLTARSIYSPAYFAADGTWTYDLDNHTEASEANEATIYDVAGAHPLIKTWRGIVDRQLDRRGIRWGKPGEEEALAAAIGLKDDDESQGGTKTAATASPRPDAAAAAAPTAAAARAPASSSTNASALDW